jgi:hypothetical protein
VRSGWPRAAKHPGLVHVISAMEACQSYKPWHDKRSGKTFLKPDSGKCLHSYFYFIDQALGLCYLRSTTWCEAQHQGERKIKGLNFFEPSEQALLRALQRPEFNIHGLCRADVKPFVPLSDSALSRLLHRLRTLGVIKRVTRSYRYYLTRLGRAAIAAACSLTRFQIVPALAHSR